MKELLRECGQKSVLLSSELRSLLDGGFEHRDGCLLLRSQTAVSQASAREQLQDDTGYECFVNHIHLDDILASNHICHLLEQAFALADQLVVRISDDGVANPLEYIISGDSEGLNVRFHIIREGQNWLNDDLETYAEAVASFRLQRR